MKVGKYDRGSLEERFWKSVDVRQEHECWNWLACKDYDGYGVITLKHRPLRTNRVSWMIHFGEIPEGLCVCHTCDNPCCVNPSHLFLGTHGDNAKDRERKGRRKIKYGDDNPNTKFSSVAIKSVLDQYETGQYTQKKLSEMSGISRSHLCAIIHGRKRPDVGARGEFLTGEIQDG